MVGRPKAPPVDLGQRYPEACFHGLGRSLERRRPGRRQPDDLGDLVVAVEQHRLNDVPQRPAVEPGHQPCVGRRGTARGLRQANPQRRREIAKDQCRVPADILHRYCRRPVAGQPPPGPAALAQGRDREVAAGRPLHPVEGHRQRADPGIVAGLYRLVGVDLRQARQGCIVEHEAAGDVAHAMRVQARCQRHQPVEIEQRIAAAGDDHVACEPPRTVQRSADPEPGGEAMLGPEDVEGDQRRRQLQCRGRQAGLCRLVGDQAPAALGLLDDHGDRFWREAMPGEQRLERLGPRRHAREQQRQRQHDREQAQGPWPRRHRSSQQGPHSPSMGYADKTQLQTYRKRG